MTSLIYPHLRTLFLTQPGSVGWSKDYLRKSEALPHISSLAKITFEKYEIDDLFDLDDFAERMFEEFIEASVITVDEHEFAGTYYKFSDGQFKNVQNSTRDKDQIYKTSVRIGNRYFPDVFDGFRLKHGDELGTPVSLSTIEGENWKSIQLEKKDIQTIRAKASELVESIKQSNLEGRIRKNALAHANAVLILLEAPDPPWKQVVELLNQPGICAFLNAITILQLIVAGLG